MAKLARHGYNWPEMDITGYNWLYMAITSYKWLNWIEMAITGYKWQFRSSGCILDHL